MKIRSKKEIEERKLKRQKFLKFLKVFLNALVYTWSIILTIGLIVGSCSKKNNKSIEPNKRVINDVNQRVDSINDFNYFYVYKYGDSGQMNIDVLLNAAENLGYSQIYDSMPSPNYVNLSDRNLQDFYVEVNGVITQMASIDIGLGVYSYYSNGSYLYRYFLQGVYFATQESTLTGYGFHTTDYDNFVNQGYPGKYPSYSGPVGSFKIMFSKQYYLDNHPYLNYGWCQPFCDDLQSTHSVLAFNYSINYYFWADVNHQKDLVANGGNYDIINSSNFNNTTYYNYVIDVPYFSSNNQLFNRIKLEYISLVTQTFFPDGVPWVTNNGQVGYFNQNGYGFFSRMVYENTLNNNSQVVYARNRVTLEDNQGYVVSCYSNDCSWLNSNYRLLNFLQALDINAGYFIDLSNLNTNSYVNDYGSGGLLDVFNLLTVAFNSILPILSISIIPNFTIGMLLCLPLVVTLIIVIVRLVKK